MPGMPYHNVQVMPDPDGDASAGGYVRTVAAPSARRRMHSSWGPRPDDTAGISQTVLSVGGARDLAGRSRTVESGARPVPRRGGTS